MMTSKSTQLGSPYIGKKKTKDKPMKQADVDKGNLYEKIASPKKKAKK